MTPEDEIASLRAENLVLRAQVGKQETLIEQLRKELEEVTAKEKEL